MNHRTLTLLVTLFLVSALLFTGCDRSLAPDLDEIGSEDLLMSEAAAETPPAETEEPAAPEEPEEVPVPVEPIEATPVAPEEAVPEEPVVVEPAEPPEEEPEAETPPEEAPPAETPVVSETPGQYTVQVGDTLYSIASRHGVSVDAVARANGITNPAFIYVGQVLTIPANGTAPAPAPQPQPQPSCPGGETIHVVQRGENLFRIALRYNFDYYYLARYNGISNPGSIYVGQRIRIPCR